MKTQWKRQTNGRWVAAAFLGSTAMAGLDGCKLQLCSDAGAPASANGTSNQAVIGGDVDNSNHSTVALIVTTASGEQAVCSGTVIAKNGSVGYVLTAAHCVTGAVEHIFEATDWHDCVSGGDPTKCGASYVPTTWKAHPLYDPGTLANDYGLVQFSGATDQTAVTPVANDPDQLAVSETVQLSGYGRTFAGPDNPALFQSARHDVNTQVATLSTDRFVFDATTGKTSCFGDSGGPAYATTSGKRVVVGVASAGDQYCEQFSIYGRVSQVYASFIAPVIAAPAPPGTSPPPSGACASCIAARFDVSPGCSSELADCEASPECRAILLCVQACGTPDDACFTGCEAPHAGGVAAADHLTACVACGSCAPFCAATACGGASGPTSATSSGSTSANSSAASSGTGGAGGAVATGSGGSTTGSVDAGGSTGNGTVGAGGSGGRGQTNNTGAATPATCVPVSLKCASSPGGSDPSRGLVAITGLAVAVVLRRRSQRLIPCKPHRSLLNERAGDACARLQEIRTRSDVFRVLRGGSPHT